MTKEEYLKLASERFDEIRKLHEHDNFYDYEKEFERIWIELGREVFQENTGKAPAERRKKKG